MCSWGHSLSSKQVWLWTHSHHECWVGCFSSVSWLDVRTIYSRVKRCGSWFRTSNHCSLDRHYPGNLWYGTPCLGWEDQDGELAKGQGYSQMTEHQLQALTANAQCSQGRRTGHGWCLGLSAEQGLEGVQVKQGIWSPPVLLDEKKLLWKRNAEKGEDTVPAGFFQEYLYLVSAFHSSVFAEMT